MNVITNIKELNKSITRKDVEFVDVNELNFLVESNIKMKEIPPCLLAYWFVDHNGFARKVYYGDLRNLIKEQKKRFGCSLIFKEKLSLPLKVQSYETLRPFILPVGTEVFISEPILSGYEPNRRKCLVVTDNFTSNKGINYKIGDEIIVDELTANKLISKGLAYEV